MDHGRERELQSGLDAIRAAPCDEGRLELLVRRPAVDEREVLDVGVLDLVEGLVGDTWRTRPSTRTPDGSPHPDMQLNVMSARAVQLVAGSRERWALAGDQLFVDLDLTLENLPTGTRLGIGSAVIEVTDQPHRGCAKFAQRFGPEALRLVNSPIGVELRLRGLNARVVVPGTVTVGDAVTKLPPSPSASGSTK
jgi:hypothetical protein